MLTTGGPDDDGGAAGPLSRVVPEHAESTAANVAIATMAAWVERMRLTEPEVNSEAVRCRAEYLS